MTTKKDRILFAAAALATTLDGSWAIASPLHPPNADVLHGPDAERLRVLPSHGRAWGYGLCPLTPRDLDGWPWLGDVITTPFFPLDAPVTEVAAHVEEHVLRPYRDIIAEARAVKERREHARARQRAAVALIATTLGVIDPRFVGNTHSVRCPTTDDIVAEIQCPNDLTRVELHISLPIDAAVAIAPALLQSIRPSHNPSATPRS